MRLPPSTAALEASLFAGRWIPYLPSVMIRRDLYLSLGGLREDLRRVGTRISPSAWPTPGAASVEAVTYLIRAHDGERGAGAGQFSRNAMRARRGITFLRAICENIYRSYPLDAFPPPAGGMNPLPDQPGLSA